MAPALTPAAHTSDARVGQSSETDDDGSSGPAQPTSALKTNPSPQDSTRASPPFLCCENRQQTAGTRRVHQIDHARARAGTRDTTRYSVHAHSNAWSSTIPVRAHLLLAVRRKSACV